jgi:Secretion system C-terminal sorting domain
MKHFYLLGFVFFALPGFGATVYWDGGGGNNLWATAANWVGNVVPVAGDDVVLDNLNGVTGTYTVSLPNTAVTVLSITITPGAGNNITLLLPSSNTLSPGLTTTNDISLNNGAIFRNSSGSANAPTITVGNGTNDSLYIYNGGTYEHNNQRSSTLILDRISTAASTAYGTFHFNIPATGSASPSLQGRIFGSLMFSAGSAPSALTYFSSSTTTPTPTVIRGDFTINSPAAFSSTMLGGFSFAGNFTHSGNFTYNPSTSVNAGTRSLYFNGTGNTQVISGTGNFSLGANFIKMDIGTGAVVNLQRSMSAFGTGDSIVVQPNATLIFTGENALSGTGSIFYNDTLSTLKIASASGITASGATGNVQNDTRIFSKKAYYHYNGTAAQATGSGLPDSVHKLYLQNPADITLSSQLCVTQQLGLDSGHLYTTAVNRLKLAVGATISSQGTNSYGESNVGNIGSFISGPMGIETNSTATLTIPVGRITGGVPQYAPVKLTPLNGTLKTYTAEYSDTGHVDKANFAASLDHVSLVEYWDIGCTINTSPDGDAKVGLSWRPKSLVGNGNPADSAVAVANLVVSHYFNDGMVGTKWNMDNGGGSTFTLSPVNFTLHYGYITTDINVGSFSPFTLGTKSPFNLLPLSLVNFSGSYRNGQVDLVWLTRQERQVARYELEKSVDGSRFSKISSLAAANRTALQTYAGVDGNAGEGWNYYRLKVIDNQQHSYYTAAIKVWVGKAPVITVGPNPAQDFLKIVSPVSSNYNLAIVNSAGQVVKRVTNAQGPFTVDIKSLDQGMYFVYILQTNRQAIVQRFVKQ